MQVQSPGREDPLEEDMATHPIFLPGESHGQRSLEGHSPWGCRVLTIEHVHTHTHRHTHMHTHAHTRAHTCAHTCTHMHTRAQTLAHTHAQTHGHRPGLTDKTHMEADTWVQGLRIHLGLHIQRPSNKDTQRQYTGLDE